MTDVAVLGRAPRLEHCAGDNVHPPADPAAAPPAIQESRGSAPTRVSENSLVPRAMSTMEDTLAVAIRRGEDYKVDASHAVRLPEGEHPPGVNVRRGVDNDVDASRAVPWNTKSMPQASCTCRGGTIGGIVRGIVVGIVGSIIASIIGGIVGGIVGSIVGASPPHALSRRSLQIFRPGVRTRIK